MEQMLAPAATADPSDPYLRSDQTFPHLTADQVARIGGYGAEEDVPDCTVLASPGQRGVDFMVVLEGTIGIFGAELAGEGALIVLHDRWQFTGELDLLNDRSILVSARAIGPTRVVRLSRSAFKQMLVGEPDVAEVVVRAFILRRVGVIAHQQSGLTIVGAPGDGDTLRIQRFLTRNGYPVRVIDPDTFSEIAEATGGGPMAGELPLVLRPGQPALVNPGNRDLADAIGLTERLEPDHVHDVIIVGAGPGGLAAAVYAASEGLDTLVIEGMAPGGQAGTSSHIENYLGFPTGISGRALAGRAHVQAQKFGARLAISREATRLDCTGAVYRIELDDGRVVQTRSVVVATGARYRRLEASDYDRFEGRGIHYAATAMEAALCRDEEIVVVGGGNSAGQAAVFLSRYASRVHMLVRGPDLSATMSDYLVQRIRSSHRIALRVHTEVSALEGEGHLARVSWRDRGTGERGTVAASNLFVMVGADPNTAWLEGCVDLDERGFVHAGMRTTAAGASPFLTSLNGVYAVGDVRAGSIKRVASSVGEGSVVVSAIHQYIASLQENP
ncbi:FAD-dependent oxidoreductase [Sphingomonas sp. DT-51]|uniref:FAD-dependent oxidoreductase n=1 Tax=Sphingomonas sp. DT-51 TaxID=3396165 RepID=UPI003F1C3B28